MKKLSTLSNSVKETIIHKYTDFYGVITNSNRNSLCYSGIKNYIFGKPFGQEEDALLESIINN